MLPTSQAPFSIVFARSPPRPLLYAVVECPHPHAHASGDIPLLIDGTTAEFQVGPDWVVSMQIVDKMNSFSSPKH